MNPKDFSTQLRIGNGEPHPLGPSLGPDGVNFAIFSSNSKYLDVLLFDSSSAKQPSQILRLDPRTNKTGDYWHVFVPGLGDGQVYGWRAHGPHDPQNGLLHDPQKTLLDPYGLAVTGLEIYDRQAAKPKIDKSRSDISRGDNCDRALRSVVVDTTAYDWEDDAPPEPPEREIIYELHVGGFTRHPSSGVEPAKRGTYAGLIEKIPYLVELGVTAVELLPVQYFDPQDAPQGLTNYWGYSSVSWFAPHEGFSSDRNPTGAVREFRDMVKALHRAGLQVILDVVFNHTAEGELDGPILGLRGLDNGAYYLRDPQGNGYADFTGCGNTVNANHSVVRRLILDALTHWAAEMHVDGFRFDLASALTRGEDGRPLMRPPIVWAIDSLPVLADKHLIAEPWDAGGLFQVGSFPGDHFAQWNGPFRDSIRRFLRGDEETIEELMARIVGSPDLFSSRRSRPSHSINFVTCHDGFSLMDLVSYERKNNESNLEQNRDGTDQNLSWNCGHEGHTTDPEINRLRQRQMRNFLCLLFLSHGCPMLTMGDEVALSHQGNNNPWCQDNPTSWLDWTLLDQNRDQLRFVRLLIRLASNLFILREDRFWAATSPQEPGDISWHGTLPGKPDWSPKSHSLAYTLNHPSGEKVMVLLNAWDKELEFTLPSPGAGRRWLEIVNTGQESPNDIVPSAEASPLPGENFTLDMHSVVVLLAGPPTQKPNPTGGTA